MGEIRCDGDKKTYRIFGFFGPDRSQFTLLHGVQKDTNRKSGSGKKWMSEQMDLAASRRDLILEEVKDRLNRKFTGEWKHLHEFEF